MGDLVERLRTGTTKGTALTWTVTAIHTEAAARITALEAQVASADRLADDLFAHRGPWMHAMTIAAHAEPDDADYWRHERAAFMSTLAMATAYRAAKGE